MRIEVVKQLLDHASLDMAADDARLLDTSIRTEWQAAAAASASRRASSTACWPTPPGNPRPHRHAERALRAAPRAKPRPLQQVPELPVFITTSADLLVHEEQCRCTLKLIAESDDCGQTRPAEQNRAVLDQLDARITEIRRGRDRACIVDPISGHAG